MLRHKGYLLDYAGFEAELRPILERALKSDDVAELRQFVNQNLREIKDPNDGRFETPLWETRLIASDAHQIGDVALTKYYELTIDFGLDSDWVEVQSIIDAHSTLTLPFSPILGHVIGPQEAPFDPGKGGSYFQSPAMVQRSLLALRALPMSDSNELIGNAIEMLEWAKAEGLYVTF